MSKRIFLDSIERYAYHAARVEGVPVVPKAVAAQAALESDWGRSQLSLEGNNLFGVKAGSSWPSPVLELPTWEVVDGHRIETVVQFRRYEGFEEAVQDYVRIIGRLDWYRDAVEAARYGDPYGYLYGLEARAGEPGWATDPDYARKVLAIMREYGLLEGPHPIWAGRVYLNGINVGAERVSIARTETAGVKVYVLARPKRMGLWRRLSGAWAIISGRWG
ncbi:glucosaminidase domain-containing protein [Oceanithermus sp.]|uniref:glycoside hydrolase family 73 protein n=1 Tax=Oceanithermus sp. TaxID=2268145 RepID=UPI0025D1D58D|nr:glucosaminidase domain-containing protein [Oceanithermus sp.]